jgi:hypothetical protein
VAWNMATDMVSRIATIMTKRPLPVTIIGCLFIAVGLVGLAYHATELKPQDPFQNDAVWVCLVRLSVIVFGVFMIRGRNWARWGLVAWMAYHIILSALHSISDLAMHTLLFGVLSYFLLRPQTSAYFRSRKTKPVT